MDAGAFVQENKRWLVGCAIGGLVWWIATMVVDSVFSTAGGRSARGALTNAYSADTRDELIEEGEALAAELANLKTELAFVVAPEYSQWTGDADGHLFLQGRKLKRAVSEQASDRDVTVDEKDLVWDSATGIDQIRAILFGLDIINEIQTRLFAAHDATKASDEDALGLYEIESIKLEPLRNVAAAAVEVVAARSTSPTGCRSRRCRWCSTPTSRPSRRSSSRAASPTAR